MSFIYAAERHTNVLYKFSAPYLQQLHGSLYNCQFGCSGRKIKKRDCLSVPGQTLRAWQPFHYRFGHSCYPAISTVVLLYYVLLESGEWCCITWKLNTSRSSSYINMSAGENGWSCGLLHDSYWNGEQNWVLDEGGILNSEFARKIRELLTENDLKEHFNADATYIRRNVSIIVLKENSTDLLEQTLM